MVVYHKLAIAALLCATTPHTTTSRITPSENASDKFITYPFSPTTHLLLKNKNEEEYTRLVESLEGESFQKDNAIYGSLERRLLENNQEWSDLLRNELREFNKHRHLSRFSSTRRDRRELSAESFQVAPLLQGLGTHYITAWVGSPPQRTSVIVDTGSRFTVFPCKGCQNCGEEYHTDHYFDPEKSSTFKVSSCMECTDEEFYCSEDRCHFGIAYAEGSEWDAYLVRDKFFLGGNGYNAYTNPIASGNAVEYTFGCETYASGLFVKQLADGIMGMAAHEGSLHHRLYDEKKLPNREYSLCFGYSFEVAKQGVYAGILTLGGSNVELHDHSMVYARDFKDHGWYTVYLRKIYLCHGGMKIDDYDFSYHNPLELKFNHEVVNSGPGTIIDSGTTDMYFPQDIFDSFAKRWYELVGKPYTEDVFYATEEEVKALPALILQLSGMKEFNTGKTLGTAHKIDQENPTDIIITVPPTYFIEQDMGEDGEAPPDKRADGRVGWISRLFFHDDDGVILGASAMRGYDVHFDVDKHRVGFARSDCNYEKRVLHNPDFRDMITTTPPVNNPVTSDSFFGGSSKSKSSYSDTAVDDFEFDSFQKAFNKGTSSSSSNVDDDLYMLTDYNSKSSESKKCKLSKLQISAPCWESVSADLCDKNDKSKTLVGLETYRADILNPGDGYIMGSCESTGYEVSDEVSLVQCFNDKYCDLVFTCNTNCENVLSKGKKGKSSSLTNFMSTDRTARINFQGAIEQPQLSNWMSKTKTNVYDVGYYGITLLLVAGIVALMYSVFKDGSALKRFTKSNKKGDYKRIATDERYFDSDDDDSEDGDCEMKSLIQSDSVTKKSKRVQKKSGGGKEKTEELSLFDEVLEENKNFYGDYVGDDEEEEEEEDKDEEFVPLSK